MELHPCPSLFLQVMVLNYALGQLYLYCFLNSDLLTVVQHINCNVSMDVYTFCKFTVHHINIPAQLNKCYQSAVVYSRICFGVCGILYFGLRGVVRILVKRTVRI